MSRKNIAGHMSMSIVLAKIFQDKKGINNMDNITEFLPFLIPLIIVEFGLLAYTLYHILTHKQYKRGNRTLWIVVTIVGMNFVGPILYFLLGREET